MPSPSLMQQHDDELADLRRRLAEAEAERDKLQAFKAWVHAYLDGQGVPYHPPGTHGAAGCRIGDRMDWLMDRVRRLEQAVATLRGALKAWEKWEADVITDDACWGGHGLAPFPVITQEHLDKLTPAQELRNKALAQTEGV